MELSIKHLSARDRLTLEIIKEKATAEGKTWLSVDTDSDITIVPALGRAIFAGKDQLFSIDANSTTEPTPFHFESYSVGLPDDLLASRYQAGTLTIHRRFSEKRKIVVTLTSSFSRV